MKETIKDFFKSWSFVISALILIAYLFSVIYLNKKVFIDSSSSEFFFYMFLEFLPLIVAIFSILISFTDQKFLKKIKEYKIDGCSLYEHIIKLFVRNSILVFLSLIFSIIMKIFILFESSFFQGFAIFLYTYTIISLIQLVRFIFVFAKKKADFTEN